MKVTLIFVLFFMLILVSYHVGAANDILAFFRAVRNAVWEVTGVSQDFNAEHLETMPGVNQKSGDAWW